MTVLFIYFFEDFHPNQLQQITLSASMAGCQCIQKWLRLHSSVARALCTGEISHQLSTDRQFESQRSIVSKEKVSGSSLGFGIVQRQGRVLHRVSRRWS